MGKRNRKEDEEYIKKKIRRLERKLQKLPAQDLVPSSASPSQTQPMMLTEQTVPEDGPLNDPVGLDEDSVPDVDQIPEEFLLALGDEGADTTETGDPIRPELAHRWSKIMTEGLGKDSKEAILKKYPTPENFSRAEAPQMNPEISASLSEISQKRDKRIIFRQNLTGKLMTCLGKSLTALLKGNVNSKLLIEEINDAAKIAAEIHHQDSSSRKYFALAGANKTVQEAVRNAKIDQFLFGADCGEKLKAAQALKKASAQIKSAPNQPTNPASVKKQQVNWKGPPPHQQSQNRGGHHQRQHTYKRQKPGHQQQRNYKRQPPRSRSRYHN